MKRAISAPSGHTRSLRTTFSTACDIRYASDRARLGEVAVPAGFVPESGGARNLPKLIGIGRAMEMILTGEIVDAAEAHRIGLVERVFPHDELRTEEGARAELDAVMEITRTQDCREGIRAFLDKRPPVYRGPHYGE